MTTDRPAEYLVGLVRELCKLPDETEWVEVKLNVAEPQEIGEHLSALTNSAALAGKAFAYLVLGIAATKYCACWTIRPTLISSSARCRRTAGVS